MSRVPKQKNIKRKGNGLKDISKGDVLELADGSRISIIVKKTIERHFCLVSGTTRPFKFRIVQVLVDKNGNTSILEYEGTDCKMILEELLGSNLDSKIQTDVPQK